MYLFIDIKAPATIVMDALGLTRSNIVLLKSKVPNMQVFTLCIVGFMFVGSQNMLSCMQVVLLASPPCQAYSKCYTSKIPRDLIIADRMVDVVRDVHLGMGALATVMENLAVRALLPGREVHTND